VLPGVGGAKDQKRVSPGSKTHRRCCSAGGGDGLSASHHKVRITGRRGLRKGRENEGEGRTEQKMKGPEDEEVDLGSQV
jgi:hypothetical protein